MSRVGLFLVALAVVGTSLTLGFPAAMSEVPAADTSSGLRDRSVRVASTLPIFPNVRITDGTSPFDWQVEPTMVLNESGRIFVGWKETIGPETVGYRVGFSYSSDDGRSWAPNILMNQTHPNESCHNSDPWLARGPDERVHFAYLEYDCSTGRSGITVSNTTDGEDWGTAHYLEGTGGLSDKESLAVDPNGRLYLAWDEAFQGNQMQLTWSDDGGSSWAPFENPTAGSVLGVIVAAAPNGHVYVTWWDIGSDNILFDWSEDGGQTWHADIRVNDQPGSAQASGTWQIPIPAMNVDPTSGTVYIFWPDSRNGNQDIFMARSTNGGQTWSANVQVNDDTGSATQYMVDLAVDSMGTVHAVWEDRRSGDWAIVYANSTDGGRTWSQNVPVTEEETPGTYNRPGDYFAIEAGPDDSIYVVWTDGRDANFDIFFAKKADVPAASVTLTTNPAGLLVRVDGRSEKSPATHVWPLGSVHNVSAPSPQPIGDTSRYVWSSWSDGGPIAHDIVATTDMTLTAAFRRQWRATFAVTPSGPSILVDNVSYSTFTTLWWDQGSTHWLEAPSPQGSASGSRFVWLSWSDRGGRNHTVTATAAYDVTATFERQYTLGLQTVPAGLNLTVDGVPYTSPATFWFPVGSSHTVSAAVSQAGLPGVRYRFLRWTDGGDPTHNVTVNGALDLTAHYVAEFYLSVEAPIPGATGEGWYLNGSTAFATAPGQAVEIGPGERRSFQGWGGDASGTGLTSDGILMDGPKTAIARYETEYYLSVQTEYGAAGGAGWYAAGASAVASVSTTDVSMGAGARQHFVGWTGDGSGVEATSDPIRMDGPKTALATWRLQYLLTIQTVYGTPAGGGWYDSGSLATASFDAPIVDLGPGERAVFVGWFGAAEGSDAGGSSPILMDGPKVVLATWRLQYLLTIQTAYGTPGGGGWYNSGSLAIVSFEAPIVDLVPGERAVFNGWSGAAEGSDAYGSSPIAMDGPKTAVATWRLQYLLTIRTAYGTAEGGGWYDSGSLATASFDAPMVDGGPGERAMFVGWSGAAAGSDARGSSPIAMDGPKTAVATWRAEYEVTVTSDIGTVEGAGWYAAGSTATLRAPAEITREGRTYEFAGWTGDVVSANPTVSFVVDRPMHVQAEWNAAGPLSRSGSVILVSSLIVVVVIAAAAVAVLRRRRHDGNR